MSALFVIPRKNLFVELYPRKIGLSFAEISSKSAPLT
jgi:hypothetical protein